MVTEASQTFQRPFLAETNIVASNDINEESLYHLADQVCELGIVIVGVVDALLMTSGKVDVRL